MILHIVSPIFVDPLHHLSFEHGLGLDNSMHLLQLELPIPSPDHVSTPGRLNVCSHFVVESLMIMLLYFVDEISLVLYVHMVVTSQSRRGSDYLLIMIATEPPLSDSNGLDRRRAISKVDGRESYLLAHTVI